MGNQLHRTLACATAAKLGSGDRFVKARELYISSAVPVACGEIMQTVLNMSRHVQICRLDVLG
jgi:hypothetical protein